MTKWYYQYYYYDFDKMEAYNEKTGFVDKMYRTNRGEWLYFNIKLSEYRPDSDSVHIEELYQLYLVDKAVEDMLDG